MDNFVMSVHSTNLEEIEAKSPVPKKRSFDVAFLISPDERLLTKQKRKIEFDEEEATRRINYEAAFQRRAKQIFDDPRQHVLMTSSSPQEKSAFTKVKFSGGDDSHSSISPELTYQNSLSPSPPSPLAMMSTSAASLPTATSTITSYQKLFIPAAKSFLSYPGGLDPSFLPPQEVIAPPPQRTAGSPGGSSPRCLFQRPELAYAYPAFPFHPPPGASNTNGVASTLPPAVPSHPAAAILNTLLPTSFAALSLPAQNVCAKCNISFRMTSDLVYHMRSHHKSEMANDSFKKRREEKLKCPVCAESFRERHHLTRHMTAHQDKEGDGVEEPSVETSNSALHLANHIRNASSGATSGGKVRGMGHNFNNVYCK